MIKKMGCGRPPDATLVFKIYDIYTLNVYGSPEKNTNLHYRKMVFTEKIIQGHAKYFLPFVWKKN